VNEKVSEVDSVDVTVEVKVEKQEKLDWIPIITQIEEKRPKKEWKQTMKDDYIYSFHIVAT
jgi:hypothetical protein